MHVQVITGDGEKGETNRLRHLKELKAAGIVVDHHPENDARVRVYALNAPRLAELKDWLARAEQGWTQQLGAFAAHVARRSAR